jgi:hypothetical protein
VALPPVPDEPPVAPPPPPVALPPVPVEPPEALPPVPVEPLEPPSGAVPVAGVSVLLHAATTEAIEISIPEVKEKDFMRGILQPEGPNVKSVEADFRKGRRVTLPAGSRDGYDALL